MRIINKTGPLYNVADRDHCLQYMVAIGLIYGKLAAEDYHDEIASDPRIDALRAKMEVEENPAFTQSYYEPSQRAIPNAVQVFFKDGTATSLITVEYPLGHRLRRKAALPALEQKFYQNISGHYSAEQIKQLMATMQDPNKLLAYNVPEFMQMWI